MGNADMTCLIELEVEKELGFSTKTQIEEYGKAKAGCLPLSF